MKRKHIFGIALICSVLAFTACQEEGVIQPPLPVLDTVLTYNVTLVYNPDYAPVEQKIDSAAICSLFGISYAEFKSRLSDNGDNSERVKYYAVKPDNTIDQTSPTAGGNGHWFNATGDVCEWGAPGYLYSEYQESAWAFNIGSRPDNTAAGQKYTIRQAFWYAPDEVTTCIAICVFNVSLVAP